MQVLLILVYSFIVIFTIVLMSILIKYTKEKLLCKNVLRNQILIDLATINAIFVLEFCVVMIARNIIGPLESDLTVKVIMITQQCFYDTVLSCIVSLQITHVLSVFGSAKLNNIGDNVIILVHRIFAIVLGLGSATFACFHEAGMCRFIPLYFYLLQDDLGNHDSNRETPINKPFVTWGFILVISLCQAVIEVKRYLIEEEELKAGVSFTNILRAAFSYESHNFSVFLYYRVLT
jgi:hypothetical protein